MYERKVALKWLQKVQADWVCCWMQFVHQLVAVGLVWWMRGSLPIVCIAKFVSSVLMIESACGLVLPMYIFFWSKLQKFKPTLGEMCQVQEKSLLCICFIFFLPPNWIFPYPACRQLHVLECVYCVYSTCNRLYPGKILYHPCLTWKLTSPHRNISMLWYWFVLYLRGILIYKMPKVKLEMKTERKLNFIFLILRKG